MWVYRTPWRRYPAQLRRKSFALNVPGETRVTDIWQVALQGEGETNLTQVGMLGLQASGATYVTQTGAILLFRVVPPEPPTPGSGGEGDCPIQARYDNALLCVHASNVASITMKAKQSSAVICVHASFGDIC